MNEPGEADANKNHDYNMSIRGVCNGDLPLLAPAKYFTTGMAMQCVLLLALPRRTVGTSLPQANTTPKLVVAATAAFF